MDRIDELKHEALVENIEEFIQSDRLDRSWIIRKLSEKKEEPQAIKQ